MRYFGKPWGPALDVGVRVETPVGRLCFRCGEAIGPEDQGCMTLVYDTTPHEEAQHRECLLRGLFGSVGHQQGRCSCHGGTEEDPPGMTKRQAARAAVALYEARGPN